MQHEHDRRQGLTWLGRRTLTGKHPAVVRISGLGKTRRIRTEQRFAVLYAVSSILLEATDLKEAAARMLQALGDGLAWEYGALWLLDDKTESLYSHTTWHTSSIYASDFEFTTRQARFLPDSLSLPGRVWSSGVPVWVRDITKDRNFYRQPEARREGLHGAFAFPIQGSTGLLGIIELFSYEVRQPDKELLHSGIALGKQIGQFIERRRGEEERVQLLAGEVVAHANQLEAIVEAIADGVFIFDREANLVQANGAGREILGLEWKPEFMELPADERMRQLVMRDEDRLLLPYEQWPVLRILQGETLKGANAPDIIFQTLDGHDLHVNVTGAPLRDSQEQIVGGVMVVRDVTKRRELEVRTHESLHALLAMAEELVRLPAEDEEGAAARAIESDPLIAIKKVGHNLAALTCGVLGCRRVGITIVEPETEIVRAVAVVGLTSEQERQWWEEQRAQESSLKDNPMPELVAALCADEALILDMTHPPFKDQPNNYGVRVMLCVPMMLAGRLAGIMTLDYGSLDHEYTQEEIALAKAVAKLAALVIERERLLRDRAEARANEMALRKSHRRMDEFLGMASHELRTPLTTIKGNVQLSKRQLKRILDRGKSSDELSGKIEAVQEMLERTDSQVNFMNRLVGDLLDASRISANMLKLSFQPELCSLPEIVRETVQNQRGIFLKLTVRLHLLSGESVPIMADPERIGQVVTNYLTNALKYSAADRTVDVTIQVEGKVAKLSVRDEGPGLSIQEQERIWEYFYQSPGIEVQNGSSVGLGLGLHICRTIIELHHGQVGVKSAPGEGSTFWFTLPLADEV